MYPKTLTERKQALINPILERITKTTIGGEQNKEILVSNPNPEILEEIRLALYTWQNIQDKPGAFKIIRQGNPCKQLRIINRLAILTPSKLTVPETQLSPLEEIAISLTHLPNEAAVIEALHRQALPPEQIYSIVQEWRRGKEEKENR